MLGSASKPCQESRSACGCSQLSKFLMGKTWWGVGDVGRLPTVSFLIQALWTTKWTTTTQMVGSKSLQAHPPTRTRQGEPQQLLHSVSHSSSPTNHILSLS